jgi:NAD-reducing hydrogenase large subunit
VDENGIMTYADLLIATAQNNYAMNYAVEQTARRFLRQETNEGMLNRLEAAIRCFDPCLSCSTHAAGQMPLVVDIRDGAGQLVGQLRR